MINRYYKDGEKLDVAGLNEITVLIDRSETELTEVGHNCWRPKLDGAPHKHNDKDQIFYVTGGEGIVKVRGKKFDVTKGNLVYVPAGILHQTITTSDIPLCYMLFNIFNNREKEGHRTFKDHIEKVKEIRRRQADSGQADFDDKEKLNKTKSLKYIKDSTLEKRYDFGSYYAILLLDRKETNKCELTIVGWPARKKGSGVVDKAIEQTFFVLDGKGRVTVGHETENVKPGNVLFVPRNTSHIIETFDEELVYMRLKALVIPGTDQSFKVMYNRVI